MKLSLRLLVAFVLISGVTASNLWAAENSQKQNPKKIFFESLLNFPLDTAQGVVGSVGGSIFNLGQIKVSSARVPSALSDAPAVNLAHNITVISDNEIAENPAYSLPELLSQKEGVNYSDEGGLGLNARVDLRGFGGEAKNALVLLDGVRAVEPFDNSVAWHLYPAEFLKQVELQRGGGSTVYGEGAFSGVIGLKTKGPTEKTHISTQSSWGDFNSQRYFADASGTVHGIGLYFGAHFEDTGGYRDNSDHDGVSALFKLKTDLSEFVRLEDAFYYADKTTGIPGPLTAAEVTSDRRQKDPDGQYGDNFTDTLTQNSLTINYLAEPVGVEFSNFFSYRLRQQDSDQSFGGAFPGISINRIGTETISDVFQGAWAFERGAVQSDLTAGIEFSADDIHNPFTFIDLTFGPFSSNRSIDRRMLGAFLQDRITLWDRLILEAGVRQDRIDWDIYDLLSPNLQKRKSAEHLSPKAGAELKLWDALSLYGSYSESFKAPDANTLIFETPNLFTPNPNIDPQAARHLEYGLRYAHPVFGSVRLDYFHIETKKEILFNDISNLNENFDTVRQGVEFANEIALSPQWQVFSTFTYTSAEFDNGVFDGNEIPLTPQTRWSAGWVARPVEYLKFSMEASGVHGQFALNDFNNRFPVKDYWTLGVRLSYARDSWEIFVKGQNLLGREYSSFVTSDGVSTVNFNPSPTRYIEGGFRIEV